VTTSSVCAPSQLSVDQTPLAEGTGQYYLAWSLANRSSTACTLPPVHPTIELDGQSGQSVQTYSVTEQPQTESVPISLTPGAKAWFLTEELATTCPSPQTVTGGPFHYSIGLGPDVGSVTWSPSFLTAASMPDLCTRLRVTIGALEGHEPRA
jgi:hypothetical protein